MWHGKIFVALCSVIQSCLTLCDHMDYSPPGSSVHVILRQKYWHVLPCPPPRDLPNPGMKPASHVSCSGRQILHHRATWEALHNQSMAKMTMRFSPVQFTAVICVPSCFSFVQLCDPMDCSPSGPSVHGIL